MGRIYKSMKGKNVDVDALRLTNEEVIAVGNLKTNARGDKLGPGGKVVQTRNQVMDERYKVTPMTSPQKVHDVQQFNKSQGVESAQGQATPSIFEAPLTTDTKAPDGQ